MAEGGEESNPFSFKKFVQTNDKRSNSNDINDVDRSNSTEVSSNSSAGARTRHQQHAVCDEPVEDTKKKKNTDENPFSFKKFLETSSSNTKAKEGVHKSHRVNKQSRFSQNTPDFATDLPDFVQNHFDNGLPSPEHSQNVDFPLPDLGFPNVQHSSSLRRNRTNSAEEQVLDFGQPFVESNSSGSPASDLGSHHLTSNNSDLVSGLTSAQTLHNSSVHLEQNSKKSHVPTILPDFLTDGVIKSSESFSDDNFLLDEDLPNGSGPSEMHNVHNMQFNRLKEENEQLKMQLEEARNITVTERKRCNKLKKEIDAVKKKEAEDTVAMETMIQQVEANLLTTTKRAVEAETTVKKLQAEVKTLQNQVAFLASENEILKSGDHGLADFKERTGYVSQQLASVVTSAEASLKETLVSSIFEVFVTCFKFSNPPTNRPMRHLTIPIDITDLTMNIYGFNAKQMLSGVENLKIMSSVLKSIDKFKDAGEKDSAQEKENKEFDAT